MFKTISVKVKDFSPTQNVFHLNRDQTCSKKGKPHALLNQREHSQQREGRNPSPLLGTCQTASQVLGPVLGSPFQVRFWHTGASSAGVHQAGKGVGTHNVRGEPENWGGFSPKKRRLRGDLIAVCHYLLPVLEEVTQRGCGPLSLEAFETQLDAALTYLVQLDLL